MTLGQKTVTLIGYPTGIFLLISGASVLTIMGFLLLLASIAGTYRWLFLKY
jgi:hypothetical protein